MFAGAPKSILKMAAYAGALAVAERLWPVRRHRSRWARAVLRNGMLGALCGVVVARIEEPAMRRLHALTERNGVGLLRWLRIPAVPAGILGAAALDYSQFWWHVVKHRVPVLWRLHAVHHADDAVDISTAFLFHAVEMLSGMLPRTAVVVALGVSHRTSSIWSGLLYASVFFHHTNVRLPRRVDRLASLVLVTPSIHGTHHSIEKEERDSNWSTGVTSVWDRLHGTLRTDVPQDRLAAGLPHVARGADLTAWRLLVLPLRRVWLEPAMLRGDRVSLRDNS